MCELCNSNIMDNLGRQIIKSSDNTYLLLKWYCKNEIDSTYKFVDSQIINECPVCKRKLGE